MIRAAIWRPGLAALLVIGLVVPAALAQIAEKELPLSERDLGALISKEQPALEERTKRAEAELAEIAAGKDPGAPWAKEWAGTYYTGDGLGMNVLITIAPKSGLTYTWNGCVGLYDANHGDIVESLPDGVRAKLAIDPRASHRSFLSERLYFVRWGERRYLVPKNQILELVNNYNEGGSARAELYGIPLKYKSNDEIRRSTREPSGRPTLPPEYAKLIVEKPIRLKIAKVTVLSAREGQDGARTWQGRVWFEGGSDQNVLLGMEFPMEEARCYSKVVIDKVSARNCEGAVVMLGSVDVGLVVPADGAELVFPGAKGFDVKPWPGEKGR